MCKEKWKPLNLNKLKEIRNIFADILPQENYGSLSEDIAEYWIQLLKDCWKNKNTTIKEKDLSYKPEDRLSRLEQKTVVISYADSIKSKDEKTLVTLDKFLKIWFPAIKGLHILPACTIVENRFNDGYFSQVERNNIHPAFGTNQDIANIAQSYFSMNDLVLGHVDIENPGFKRYLAGSDKDGQKFYVFGIEEYEKMWLAGSFDKIFRPRPFPLFTIFRRLPKTKPYCDLSYLERVNLIIGLIREKTQIKLDAALVGVLYLFNKIKNDQMLLKDDYKLIEDFLSFLELKGIDVAKVFTKSLIQEVRHIPYVFVKKIDTIKGLLLVCGYNEAEASFVADVFIKNEATFFGEEVRVLTTFSHVQVDVNTASFEGLSALANDLVWYLSKDFNMLRLDAVNYAFKKWGTSCFGLPELDGLIKIIYLSMDCVSPRMIPNLEVNDSLSTILKQMTAPKAAPPMMHDFVLASLLPAVFHSKNPEIIGRIYKKISEFNLPYSSIRFSLSESHDGKSVRGSLDLLTFEERMVLANAVKENGGYVKYKSIPTRVTTVADLKQFCSENDFSYLELKEQLFNYDENDLLNLKKDIGSFEDVRKVLNISDKRLLKVADFFFSRIIEGQDPYELCISTRDSLPVLKDENIEAERFLSFETLAFAIMGRNVKTIYFNDLLALGNDVEKVKKTGELRNIKRTKLNYEDIVAKLKDKNSFEFKVAKGINNLIALVDCDPSLNFRGNEAEFIKLEKNLPVAVIKNKYKKTESLTVVNLSGDKVKINLCVGNLNYDNISRSQMSKDDKTLELCLKPYQRLWLTKKQIEIPFQALVS